MNDNPPKRDFDFGTPPDMAEVHSRTMPMIGDAIRRLEDEGLATAGILYHLIYASLAYATQKPLKAEEVPWSLMAIAAHDAGMFCEPEDFRPIADEFVRLAKATRRNRLER